MPIQKLGKDEFDPDALDVDYDDTSFPDYDGPIPPSGTILSCYIDKMWLSYTEDDTPMFKVIVVAESNGSKENDEYDGLAIWDNLVFKPTAAFRYQPFLEVTGITLKDIAAKMVLSDEDDSIGAPIEKIGKWEPGEDSVVRVLTKKERWEGEWRAKVKKYLPEAEEEPEEEEEAPPARGSRRTTARKPPARAARGAAKTRRAAEPEEEPEDGEEEPERPARTRRAAAKPAAKTATRRRGARGDDPPF